MAKTIFGFFTRTEGDALVISLSDPEKWKNTLRTRLGLTGADVILFDEKDWLIPELKSKSIDELQKKYSQIISTIKKKLLLQGVPEHAIDEVMKKAEVIPNPISGLVVFVVAYSGNFENTKNSQDKEQDELVKEIEPEFESFTDHRDGKTYKTVKIGNQIWMAENLNFVPKDMTVKKEIKEVEYEIQKKKVLGIFPMNIKVGKEIGVEIDEEVKTSWCYDNNPENGTKYGRLYTWDRVKLDCPTGWHLPTKEEWETLYKVLGDDGTKVYNALKEGGNAGFNVLLGGYYHPDGSFHCLGSKAFFWSATVYTSQVLEVIAMWHFVYSPYYSNFGKSGGAGWDQRGPGCGMSVRLMKDN